MRPMLPKYHVLNIGYSKLPYCIQFNNAGGQNTMFADLSQCPNLLLYNTTGSFYTQLADSITRVLCCGIKANDSRANITESNDKSDE